MAELKKGGSETRQLLDQMIEEIVDVDPEFILKVSHLVSICDSVQVLRF